MDKIDFRDLYKKHIANLQTIVDNTTIKDSELELLLICEEMDFQRKFAEMKNIKLPFLQ